MSSYGVIYIIKNTITDKVYVGQTTRKNPYKRINTHFRRSNCSYISKSIRKYGKDSFFVEIIASALSKEDLDYLEVYFISKFNCVSPNGYNLTTGGKSSGKLSNQAKLKISLKRKKLLRENGAKWKGKKRTVETRKKMSDDRKGFTSRNRRRALEMSVTKRKIKGDFVRITAIHIDTGESFKYNSIADCCKDLNLDPTCVSRVCRGLDNRSQHKGYRFITEKHGDPEIVKRTPKYIYKVNKGGYSVKIKGNYIGYRLSLKEAIELKEATIRSKYKKLED